MAISITRSLLTYFGGMRVNLLTASMTAAPDSGYVRQHEARGGVLIAPVSVAASVADHFVTWTVRAAGAVPSAVSITLSGAATTPTGGVPRLVAWGR